MCAVASIPVSTSLTSLFMCQPSKRSTMKKTFSQGTRHVICIFFVCCLLFKLISDHFLLCLTNISWHPLQWDVYFTLYILYMKITCRWGCNATNNKDLFQGLSMIGIGLKSIALPYGVTGHMVIWSSARVRGSLCVSLVFIPLDRLGDDVCFCVCFGVCKPLLS